MNRKRQIDIQSLESLTSLETIDCPYCGKPMTVLIEQLDDEPDFIEDCQTCCQPILISVERFGDEPPHIQASRSED